MKSLMVCVCCFYASFAIRAQGTLEFGSVLTPQGAIPSYEGVAFATGQFKLSGNLLSGGVAFRFGTHFFDVSSCFIEGPSSLQSLGSVYYQLQGPSVIAPYPPYSPGGVVFSLQVVLNERQTQELLRGFLSVNLSSTDRLSELRGPIQVVPEPSVLLFMVAGTVMLSFQRLARIVCGSSQLRFSA